MGRIIGVCNQKGGTGKTTTAINVASYLALAKKKTLLIDMDPQGNAGSGVGVEREGKNSIYEVVMGDVGIEEAIYSTQWTNLSLIPSQISLTGGEIELVNEAGRETRLKKELAKIVDRFDYIIIDAPPSLGLLTLNVLAAANGIIVPVQCEYYALEGVSNLLNTIDLVKERLNNEIEIDGVVLTMGDFRTKLTLQVIEEIRNHFKEKAFNTVIPRNIRLAEAPSFGQPIHFYDANCVGAKAYLALVEEMLKEKIVLSPEESTPETNVTQEAKI
jgi:chromosome partitioning protein